MGEVVKLEVAAEGSLAGHAAASLREAIAAIGGSDKIVAAVIVVLAGDNYALRSVSTDAIEDFDKYARAGAVLDARRASLID